MRYSFIIPVYNRPDETDELLESLSKQTFRDFEVLVVEDGSQITCQQVVQAHAAQMPIKYFSKPNSGPGQTRNYGAERSQGEYLIFLDSDCVLPPEYLEAVERELSQDKCDAFGGPDRSHPSFTPIQKAISYSMTSFFTTGGIRGGRKKLDRFYPRSFNMGILASLYRKLGGFSQMRFGEDIDLSIRIIQSGASCRLFPEAWVWHKRRTDLRKFFRQVHNSGIARINLYKKYPSSLKLVHLLPAVYPGHDFPPVALRGRNQYGHFPACIGMGRMGILHSRSVGAPAPALFTYHYGRQHPAERKCLDRTAQCGSQLCAAHRLWNRIPESMVATLCVWMQ